MTISPAVLPTAFIVIAQKINAIIQPTKSPQSSFGFIMLKSYAATKSAIVAVVTFTAPSMDGPNWSLTNVILPTVYEPPPSAASRPIQTRTDSINAANNAMAVRAAEPMAKPFPVAAVVLPRASSASVFFLTSSPNPLISALPPALSAIGPYASVASVIPRVASMPTAAKPIPYSPRPTLLNPPAEP